MDRIKIWLFLIILMGFIYEGFPQKEAWFFIEAKDTTYQPEFVKRDNLLLYNGNDEVLNDILNNHQIKIFRKTQRSTNRGNEKRTFFVIADDITLMEHLVSKAGHLFVYGTEIPIEDRAIFEPNDYGLTSTIGENIGAPIDMDYLDVLGLPQAWYYTTGHPDVVIGISDGAVDTTSIELKHKTTIIRKSIDVKGHGTGVAYLTAGQGDNGFAGTGVCYDCSIYTTTYGDFRNFKQLLELAELGVKVINCSWASGAHYEHAQQVINKIYDMGTLIVASSGNNSYLDTKGKKFLYPSSYSQVISVSQVMYKYMDPQDNILYEPGGTPYAENVLGYLSRTVGFENHDLKGKPKNYLVSIPTLNSEVDILAPSVGLFRYAPFLKEGEIVYTNFMNTSSASPFVSGAIGLMYSMVPCLPIDQVESILKLTTTRIDLIDANKPFEGLYGAGMLHTGRAIELLYNLYSPQNMVMIKGHDFTRWDFKLTSYAKEIRIEDQSFRDNATLDLSSAQRIVIGQNTVLKPNEKGHIRLHIDQDLVLPCEKRLRDPGIEAE